MFQYYHYYSFTIQVEFSLIFIDNVINKIHNFQHYHDFLSLLQTQRFSDVSSTLTKKYFTGRIVIREIGYI